MNKKKEEILKELTFEGSTTLLRSDLRVENISKSLDEYAETVRNEVLEECLMKLDQAKKDGASSTLGMAIKIISQLRQKEGK